MPLNNSRTLKSTILWLFMPIIVLFVVIIGLISYILASEQLRQNAFTSISDTVSQTERFLNDKLTDIATSFTALDNDSDLNSMLNRLDAHDAYLEPQDYVKLNKSLGDAFINRYGVVDSVMLYYNDGKIALQKKEDLTTKAEIPLDYYAVNFDQENLSLLQWLNIHPSDSPNLNKLNTKIVSLYKLFGKNRNQPKGILLFQFKDAFFKTILANPHISTNGYMCLVSKDGVMSFKHVEDRYDLMDSEIQGYILDKKDPSGQLTVQNKYGEKLMIIYDTLAVNKWRIAAVLPESELLQKVTYIKYVILSAMLFLIVLAIFLSNILANIITKPITNLTSTINSIKDGNLDIHFKEMPQNEIGILNRGLRDMIHRIKDLLKQVEEEQEKKRTAEMAALQSQIQPHFLYNTLYSIKQLCEMEGNKVAGAMVSNLSSFFRLSISQGSEIIPISHEIEHIQSYLHIQEMRYIDDFTYEIHMDPDMLSCQIVKLTLQPLIENAIYHGMKLSRSKGTIRIVGTMTDEECIIRVEDNGAGMSEEKLEALNASLRGEATGEHKLGLGVQNVHRRLQLNYGNAYGLHFESKQGEGTTVTVKVKRME